MTDTPGELRDGRQFVAQSEAGAVVVRKDELRKWSASAAFPLLPSPESFEVFLKMREAPSIGQPRSDFEFCPVQGDFNQTTDASLWSVGDLSKAIPVLKGASFEIWSPDAGLPHGSAAVRTIHDRMLTKLQRQIRTSSSAFHGMDAVKLKREGRLPYQQPRIAFRDIARATDTRTTIASLVPPVVLINSAPFLVRRSGSLAAEAYVLGVMCSIPFDWYSRRYVELHMNFHIFNWLPVPTFDHEAAVPSRIVEISGRLAAIDDRYSQWASEVGVPIGSVKTQDEKDDLVGELDALVSVLYGLTEDQIEHVFATFHRGWEYRSRLDSVLKHYRLWRGKN